jgi:hypothetical protein
VSQVSAAERQAFAICVLAADFFAEAFFRLGFLASRLERFCSLFAIISSAHGDGR